MQASAPVSLSGRRQSVEDGLSHKPGPTRIRYMSSPMPPTNSAAAKSVFSLDRPQCALPALSFSLTRRSSPPPHPHLYPASIASGTSCFSSSLLSSNSPTTTPITPVPSLDILLTPPPYTATATGSHRHVVSFSGHHRHRQSSRLPRPSCSRTFSF